ncbi:MULTISPECIES: LysR family transcriptional regulator [Corynebacterium]|jgi:DNA-binding transcriptional LysR family regulator|uniref:Hca operon transcriptional activator HcaR n=1 Tax=Corynebacterium provencense TaxID=1737425 RepID=A0A2Z3YQ43_9CORY|nr:MULTISPECIES: LysR family transcriptional regulator [Corynebacterium]AWT25691.1 Hca operon transcriptional activator HcaR [Corynebacterium provencense]MCI1256278.1 LysR family transcriptional regulator [Corynebacterium provencense]
MIDHRLTVLRTFATCGTVTEAASALGYSPSAVSSQIREYQRAVGIALVERDGRGLRLTAAGRILVEKSDELVTLWERIHGEAEDAAPGREPAALRLGGFSSATGALLSSVAASLHGSHPGLDVSITEAEPDRCIDLLTAERLDVAVTVAMQAAPDADNRRIEQFPLLDDPLDVLLPVDHPLADRSSVRLEELADDPWVADHPGTTYRALFTTAFTAAGATPRVVHEVADWVSSVEIVSRGLGVGLVPRLVQLSSDSPVVRKPLDGPSAPRRRVLVMLRRGSGSHPVIRETVQLLREAADESAGL